MKGGLNWNEIVLDHVYMLPTSEWVIFTFAEAFAQNLKILGLDCYVPDANDCDKIAMLAMSLARICSKRTGVKASLAFGMFNYTKDSGVQHSINFAIVKKGHNHDIIYFDPQNEKELAEKLWLKWQQSKGGSDFELEKFARKNIETRTKEFGKTYQNIVLDLMRK